MPDSCTRLYVHLVWATWDRMPLITPELEAILYAAMVEKCQQLRCKVLAIGGIEDHVHLLASLHPDTSVSMLMHGVKGLSSHLVNSKLPPAHGFRWQGGYGAFTLAAPDIRRVSAYVLGQKEHHKMGKLLPNLERCTEQDGNAPAPKTRADGPNE